MVMIDDASDPRIGAFVDIKERDLEVLRQTIATKLNVEMAATTEMLDIACEVLPDQPCIWTEAWQRAARMPKYGGEIHLILSPLDRRQQDRSAWLNDLLGLPDSVPQGWAE